MLVTVAWGEGVNLCLPVPLPLDRSLVACPNMCTIMLSGALGTPLPLTLSVRVPPPPRPTKHIFRIYIFFMDYLSAGL
jgi:hypothetical protein